MRSSSNPAVRRVLALAGALSLLPGVPQAETRACTEIQEAKKRVYGVRPSAMSRAEQDAKSKELDGFWALVKSRGAEGVRCLRDLIAAETGDGYFSFDAVSLLASLDRSPAALRVISLGLLRTDFNEINPPEYVKMALWLRRQGIDIGQIAEKYLRAPKVDGTVPQHAMKLDREGGAILLYGSMVPTVADRYLIAALKAPEPYAQETAAQVLALSMTEEGLRALKSLGPMPGFSQAARRTIEGFVKRAPSPVVASSKLSRREVLATLAKFPNYGRDFFGVAGDKQFAQSAVATLTARDVDAVRTARQKCIIAVSDEVISEYFALTGILLDLVNRWDLYRDLRQS